jgi:hypothetical protein
MGNGEFALRAKRLELLGDLYVPDGSSPHPAAVPVP